MEPENDEANLQKKILVKRVLFFTGLLVLFFWLFSERKVFYRFSGSASAPGQERPIAVNPEVLNLQESFAQVSETLKPAVVNITTLRVEEFQSNPFEFYFWDPDDLFDQFFNLPQPKKRPPSKKFQRKIPGTGSGVIIDPDGYILTNEHVVRGADEIKVTLPSDSEKQLTGKVIGRDERTDLAVIRIQSAKKLPFARLGDSDAIRVGDWAIAIGSPFGLEQTVTVGVISATRQNLPIDGRNYKDLIQTDAAINPGNSGGPLLNIHGEVIGINTAIYTPSGGFAGIGFAIPISRAKEIIPQLKERGKVVRGWMGVYLEDKLDEAKASVFGVPDMEGAMVRKVLPGYPAAKAGFKRGDIIREYNGKKVKSNNDLQALVAATPPNKKVPVKILRNRKEMTLELTVEEAPSTDVLEKQADSQDDSEPEKQIQEGSWLGARVQDLRSNLRDRLRIPESEQGVIVAELEPGSKAEEIGLAMGDLVRAVNQEPVPNVKTFKEVVRKIKTEKGVVFDIIRQGEPIYLSYMGPEK